MTAPFLLGQDSLLTSAQTQENVIIEFRPFDPALWTLKHVVAALGETMPDKVFVDAYEHVTKDTVEHAVATSKYTGDTVFRLYQVAAGVEQQLGVAPKEVAVKNPEEGPEPQDQNRQLRRDYQEWRCRDPLHVNVWSSLRTRRIAIHNHYETIPTIHVNGSNLHRNCISSADDPAAFDSSRSVAVEISCSGLGKRKHCLHAGAISCRNRVARLKRH